MFSLLEIMQFLSLFALINLRHTSTILVSYYRSLSVATLEFLPNIFQYIVPDRDNPSSSPDDQLTESFALHPNIFSYPEVPLSPMFGLNKSDAFRERTSCST